MINLRPFKFRAACAGVSIVVLGGWYGVTFLGAYQQIAEEAPYDTYRVSASWLARNSLHEELIFTADWDDFPRLFYFNTHNTYLSGLDPYFLYARDKTKFSLWKELTQGQSKQAISQAILQNFGTRYVFLDRAHTKLEQSLAADQFAKMVFRTNDSSIFLLTPEGETSNLGR